MKLLTKEIEAKLPKMYATEKLSDEEKFAVVKFFSPAGAGTWYGIEYDPQTRMFFGYVTGLGEDEYGYFSLDELEKIRLPFGLRIERDRYFTPTKMADIIRREYHAMADDPEGDA